MLDIEGCIVVADALNCQKATAEAVLKKEADYLFVAKDNQPTLKKDIEDFVQDDDLRQTMDTAETHEINRDRDETRRRSQLSTLTGCR